MAWKTLGIGVSGEEMARLVAEDMKETDRQREAFMAQQQVIKQSLSRIPLNDDPATSCVVRLLEDPAMYDVEVIASVIQQRYNLSSSRAWDLVTKTPCGAFRF